MCQIHTNILKTCTRVFLCLCCCCCGRWYLLAISAHYIAHTRTHACKYAAPSSTAQPSPIEEDQFPRINRIKSLGRFSLYLALLHYLNATFVYCKPFFIYRSISVMAALKHKQARSQITTTLKENRILENHSVQWFFSSSFFFLLNSHVNIFMMWLGVWRMCKSFVPVHTTSFRSCPPAPLSLAVSFSISLAHAHAQTLSHIHINVPQHVNK